MSNKPTSSITAGQGFEQVAPLFAALSDSTRLQLVAQLSSEGPQSISALAQDTSISRQAVTKHLRILEDTGLAASRRTGRKRIFELRPEQLSKVHRHLDKIAKQWDQTLDRLKTYVENESKVEEK